jgi:Carboxypeptidase regulatory-like domain/TonB dependent receptor
MKAVSTTLCVFLAAMAVMAQTDRGSITGTVTDPAAAVVPGARIVARNVDTGTVTEGATTATGNYTLTSLTAGTYDVSAEAAGFKKLVQSAVKVQVAQTERLDFSLQVGVATDSVTVTGETPVLKTENAEQSMNVSGDKVNNLPLNFGGGGTSGGNIRNWMSFIILAPGVSGTSPTSPVNGIPTGSYGNFKVYLEGQDSTSINDANWTSSMNAASVETINEFAVQSSNFSPEFGQVAGGFYNFTTKSGTNQLHGSAYEYWANEALDAAHPFSHVLDRDRKNDYGFTIGGPVWIPKIYHGKNKTFFFFSLERFGNSLTSTSSYSTVPTAAYRNGDFSGALTGKTLTDPTSGLTFPENGIYDPSSTQTVNGRVIRTLFPNNTIPKSMMDPVALKIQAMIPAAINSQNLLNWVPNLANGTQQQMPSFKIDHNLSDLTRLSFYYSYQSTTNPAYPDGLPEPLTGARPKTVQGWQYRLNLDRTISPRLVVHVGGGFYRFLNPDSSPAGVINYDAVGQLGLVGGVNNPAGFPYISGLGVNNQGGAGYSGPNGNLGPNTVDHQFNSKLSWVASATYVRGSHTYKTGIEMKQDVYSDQNLQGAMGQYSFGNGPTAVPFLQNSAVGAGSIGAGYASFLLGDVTYTNVNAPRDTQMRRLSWSVYLQDNWKLTRKLTLDYGLRWDYTPMGHEQHYREAEIGINTPNPSAGGIPGGYIFEGYGTGRCNCEFSRSYPFAFGPRLAVAYQINAKTVFRAGWGLTYSGGDSWGYMNGGTPVSGLGINSVTNSTGYGYAVSQFQSGIHYNMSDLYTATLNPGIAPQPGTLAVAPAWAAQFLDPDGGRPARVNQWNISLQRQLNKDMTLEAAYVGNRGAWEESRSLAALNAISPARLQSLGLDLTNAATRTLLTSQICSTAAVNAGYKLPYASFPCTASVAQSLRPFPEYNDSLAWWFAPTGDSWYDSLQVKFTRRFSHGLDITSNFTYQKEQCLGSVGCAGANDSFNRAENKGLTPSSTPFIWVTSFTYQTPKLTTNKLVRQLTGGWTWGGILRYASGSLISVASSRTNLNTWTFNTNTRFDRVAGQPLFLEDPNCHCINPNSNQQIFNPAAWVDTATGTWGSGSAYYNDYRWQHQASESMNLGRSFQLREKMSLNVRAEFFNVFNRLYLPTPSASNPVATSTFNSAGVPTGGFGFITNSAGIGGQRNGQLVARFQF